MKKFILSFLAMLTIGASTILAGPFPDTSHKVMESFKREFAGARLVKWSTEGNYAKISFLLGGTRAVALFSREGELVGTVRDILFSQLPIVVIKTLDCRFKSADIYEIREITNEEGTFYRLMMEKNGKKYRMSLKQDGLIEEMSKVKN